MIGLLLLVLAQEGGWQVAPRAELWFADQSHSRTRAMEQEAVLKGGTGRGSVFDYDDVGADGLSFIPALSLRVRHDADEFLIGGFTTEVRGTATLDNTLEYDGDLHFAGARVRSEFSMNYFELGYSRRIAPGLRLGVRAVQFEWSGSVRELSSVTPPTDPFSAEKIRGYKIPVIHALYEWSIAPSLCIDVEGAFGYQFTSRRSLGAADNGDGLVRFAATLRWTIGPLTVGAGLGYFALDAVSFEHHDEADLLNYRVYSLNLGLSVVF